jgi:hypothetical protein
VRIWPYFRSGLGEKKNLFKKILQNIIFYSLIKRIAKKVETKFLFVNGDSKTARIPPDLLDKNKPSNPPEIGSPPEIFCDARQLLNPPELSKSGGENRHLATLQAT